jgi:hypothetical protein
VLSTGIDGQCIGLALGDKRCDAPARLLSKDYFASGAIRKREPSCRRDDLSNRRCSPMYRPSAAEAGPFHR